MFPEDGKKHTQKKILSVPWNKKSSITSYFVHLWDVVWWEDGDIKTKKAT